MPRIRDLKDGYKGTTSSPAASTVAPVQEVAGATGYALAALNSETMLVATAVEGTRNDTLNRAAFNMAQLVASGQLPPGVVVAELTAAARANGLEETEILRTLQSALPAGEKLPRALPAPLPEEDTAWLDSLADGKPGTGNEPAAAAFVEPSMAEQMFNRDVALEIHREHVRDATRRFLKQEKEAGQHRARIIGLTEFLDEPDNDVEYRIIEAWPTGGRVVFAAQYKAGKSTAVGNIVRSLADGDPFLGQFTTAPAARIVLIDNELDERTLRRWLRDQGIQNTAAVTLVPLRGKVSTFDILDEDTRNSWAAAIHGADVVILDCLRPVLDALGLSEDKDAGRFLVAFDTLLETAGISEALVVHHMGHGGQRSRGDSRILDWPDATWKLVRQDPDDLLSARYFSAFGRDVEIPESLLEYNSDTRHLNIIGGSRHQASIDEKVDQIVDFVTMHRCLSTNKIQKMFTGRAADTKKALDIAVMQGRLGVNRIGGANIYDLPGQ